jgi:hypothetical protein
MTHAHDEKIPSGSNAVQTKFAAQAFVCSRSNASERANFIFRSRAFLTSIKEMRRFPPLEAEPGSYVHQT